MEGLLIMRYDEKQVRSILRGAIDLVGSQLLFAEHHGISPAYVSDVLAGRRMPGASILKALKLKKEIFYCQIDPPRRAGD